MDASLPSVSFVRQTALSVVIRLFHGVTHSLFMINDAFGLFVEAHVGCIHDNSNWCVANICEPSTRVQDKEQFFVLRRSFSLLAH